jgi:hypothetical protein
MNQSSSNTLGEHIRHTVDGLGAATQESQAESILIVGLSEAPNNIKRFRLFVPFAPCAAFPHPPQ